MADRGGCHFTDEIAVPFPSSIFLELMGLPWEELDVLLRFKDGILRYDGSDPAERAQVQAATGQEIDAYSTRSSTSGRGSRGTTSSAGSSPPRSTASG